MTWVHREGNRVVTNENGDEPRPLDALGADGAGLRLAVRDDPRHPVLHVAGVIDLANVEEFQTTLINLLDQSRHCLLVNLSQVTFLDSMALRALMIADRHASGHGGCLLLVDPSEPVRQILTLTGLDATLTSFPSLPEALTHLQPQ
jgi:anti-sigma B factor antagonist